MTPELHARAREVFLNALPLDSAQRDQLIDDHCGSDRALRDEVRKLLACHVETVQAPSAANRDARASEDQGPSPQDDRLNEVLSRGNVLAQRFEIVDLLGIGGMGTVYLAKDRSLDQIVALKVLSRRFLEHRDWLEYVRNEVRLARKVTHPNVCRIFDIGTSNDHVFISMEYVEGESLASLLKRRGRLPLEKAIDIARQLCTGLAAAHNAGVWHRDLKPANILISEDGRVRLADFGLALASGGKGRHLRAGTPAYMAPEQITGRGVDAHSDIYALGLILYELFAGRPAFHADTLDAYIALHEHEDPPPLSDPAPELDPALVALVHWCLRKNPNDRPPTALAVAAALPGVDVLAVALAADQLPAPELVAAAPTDTVAVRSLGRISVGILIACCALPLLRAHSGLPWEQQGALPTDVLATSARGLLPAAGAPENVRYQKTGYCSLDAARRIIEPTAPAADPESMTAEYPILYWLRAGPYPLLPHSAEVLLLGDSRVSLQDPPLASGEQVVLMDRTGRMVAQVGADSSTRLRPTAPVGDSVSPTQTTFRLLALVVILACLPIAWSNYRHNRGDRKTALLFSFYLLGAQLVTWLIGAHHAATLPDEVSLLAVAVIRAIAFSAIACILYLALEPLARRYWPHLLIGWTRLFRVSPTDPLVWQHVLLGIGIGVFWAVWGTAEWVVVSALGWTPTEPFLLRHAVDRLEGGRAAVANTLGILLFGIMQGVIFATLLALARAIVRAPLHAGLLASLLAAPVLLPRGAHLITSPVFMGLGVIVLGLWVTARYGLLALCIASGVAMLLGATPLGWQTGVGLSTQAYVLFAAIVLLTLVAWGRGAAATSRHGAVAEEH